MIAALGKQCLRLVPRLLAAWLVYLVAAELILSLGAREGLGRQVISTGKAGVLSPAPDSIDWLKAMDRPGEQAAPRGGILVRTTVSSLWATGMALLICLAFGPVLGVLAGRFRRLPWVDALLFPLLVAAWIPGFWLACLANTWWVTRWGHPASFDAPFAQAGPVAVETWWRVAVVGVLVAVPGIGWQVRAIAGDLKSRARDPGVAAAFARGVTGGELFYRHVLGNRWEFVVRSLDRSLPVMIGVQVIVEWTLAYPGLGRLLVDAARSGLEGLTLVAGGILASLVFLARWCGELGGSFLSHRRRSAPG